MGKSDKKSSVQESLIGAYRLDFITMALNVVGASPLAGSTDYDSEELVFPDEREIYEPTDTEINNYFNEALTRNLHLD